jgi:hypothetical protein
MDPRREAELRIEEDDMRAILISLLLSLFLPGIAYADGSNLACNVSEPLDGQRLLRRLSLDLRDTLPSAAEATAQSGTTTVSDSTVDQFLASNEFVDVMHRYHQNLLWPNDTQADLTPEADMIYPVDLAPGTTVYMSYLRSVFSRTISGQLFYPCLAEPATFDANGQLVATPLMQGSEIVAWQEGYVEVEPYWAPGTTVKVCGYDAQNSLTAPTCPGPDSRYPYAAQICQQLGGYAMATGTPFMNAPMDCGSQLAQLAPGCGCGPNLRFCHTPETSAVLRQSFLDQEMRLIDQVVSSGRPYTDVVLTKNIEVNGPIAHYLNYQSRLSGNLFGDPDPSTPIPDGLTWTSSLTWIPVVRSGRHSGVLTAPGYILRFATNRSRANRFYNAFECSAFIPNGPLPSPFEPCSKHEDLTKRCGCNACHGALEPMAAHWGRFAEYGVTTLDDTEFPTNADATCAPPFKDFNRAIYCYRFYNFSPVGEQVPFKNMLNPYVFRTPEQVATIEAGPAHLAQTAIDSGAFASCTATKMWTLLMRRAPTPDETNSVIPDLAKSFSEAYDIKALAKKIVTSPEYRRVP